MVILWYKRNVQIGTDNMFKLTLIFNMRKMQILAFFMNRYFIINMITTAKLVRYICVVAHITCHSQ